MKTKVHETLEAARPALVPNWTHGRQQRVWQRIERARAERSRWLAPGSAVVVLLAAVALFTWSRSHARPFDPLATTGDESRSEQGHSRPRSPEGAGLLVRTADGSTAVALCPSARVETVESAGGGTTLRLEQGVARFDVAPQHQPFHVLAGNVVVTVVGTSFVVGLEATSVRVEVERGRVHIAWPGGERALERGEKEVVAQPPGAPPEASSASAERAEPADKGRGTPAEQEDAPAARSRPGAPAWRALARRGDYAAAYDAWSSRGSGRLDDPGDLLLAADAARLSGHPDAAVKLLERVITRHAHDPRAALAAFTRGRVLLDQLGRPRDAAEAFATTRRLAPEGALAQDALAREVESWSRAGASDLARARAQEFVERYPGSKRARAVRRLGGIE